MSRNHRKNRKAAQRRGKPKVTETVTDAAPPAAPAPEPVIETTQSEVDDAMEFAAKIGENLGHVRGFDVGFQQGKLAPRNAGEQRVQVQTPAAAMVLNEVFAEIKRAIKGHGPMRGPHEGYAVILEELDELWAEVKADRGMQKSARAEAIQVAAMAVRYALDIDPR